MSEEKLLQSAGAVVLAGEGAGRRVAVLHRRGPDEWRLPKGKLEPGETPAQAAARELLEETGLRAEMGEEIGRTEYTYGRATRKIVTFYVVRLPEPVPLVPENPPFDEARWMPVPEALAALTWGNERELVEKAVGTTLPPAPSP